MPLGREVGLGQSDIVVDGDPAPPIQKGAEPLPPILAHFCCGQTAGWIKMPGRPKPRPHCVTWGHADMGTQLTSPKKGAQPPIFGRCLLWPNGRPSQILLSTCITLHFRQSVSDHRMCYAALQRSVVMAKRQDQTSTVGFY